LGILAQWVAWKTKVPAILPLIIIGLLVGPFATLYMADGQKLIDPSVFGQYLFYFVSLSIGIILFEGGLTLQRREIKDVGGDIIKLITLGSLITFIGAGLAAHYILDLSWPLSFLFGGLIIVTGPTVIAPILRNTPLKQNVATVLKWEGILIDPIGALVAVLVFEFIRSGEGAQFTMTALTQFGWIVFVGTALGFAAAYALYYLLKKHLIPHYLMNVFVLAVVLGVFAGSDYLAHESGLLTVVVMGMVMGNLDLPGLKEILDFKESLTVLLISVLFILLSANMNVADLELLLNWNSLILFGIVILILRPMSVFASTTGGGLETNEKWFISWVGPRGIVAAGVASLFGLKLVKDGVPGAELITPLVFMVVLGTVLLNATTATWMARLLGVSLDHATGFFIVGANPGARLIGSYLKKNDVKVVLLDNNQSLVEEAESEGLVAIRGNIFGDEWMDEFDLMSCGHLMAITGSLEVNKHAIRQYGPQFGKEGAYRVLSPQERNLDHDELDDDTMFSPHVDYLDFSETMRDYPKLNECIVDDAASFEAHINFIRNAESSIPVLLKRDDEFSSIPVHSKGMTISKGTVIVYLGKELQFDSLSTEATS